jgi:sulfur carrier protein ThiS
MHRGSSNGDGDAPRPLEILPLSASRPLEVTFALTRAGSVELRVARVAAGTPLRRALRSVGLFGEGSTVLSDGRPVPLDTPIVSDGRWTVIPAFSGG